MLLNSASLAGLITQYTFNFFAPATGIYLCVGTMPTDAQIDAMTVATDALITGNKAVSYGAIPATNFRAKDTNIPCLMYSAVMPVVTVVNSTKAGTLGWAVLHNGTGFAIADVGLANSGAVVQVDTTTVIIGTPVTLLTVSYKFGR